MIPKEKHGAVILNLRRGFTTFELLIVIAILLTVAAIAFPNISGWARNQRLKGVARNLVSHFQFARLEAIKRNTPVELTFYLNSEPIKDSYIVSKEGVTLIDVRMPAGVTLECTTFVDDKAGYNARGFPVLGNGGTVSLCINCFDPEYRRSYEVEMRQTSGGLSLNGPLSPDDLTICP